MCIAGPVFQAHHNHRTNLARKAAVYHSEAGQIHAICRWIRRVPFFRDPRESERHIPPRSMRSSASFAMTGHASVAIVNPALPCEHDLICRRTG
jgi:hypothetical protein